MVIDHGVINAQIENILKYYDANVLDSTMNEYLENLYSFQSKLKLKDVEYSFKDRVWVLKTNAFDIKLDMNFEVKIKPRNNVGYMLDIICKYPVLKYEFNDAYIDNMDKDVSKVMFKHLETMLGDFQYNLNHYVSNIKRDMKNNDLVYTRSFFEVERNRKHIYAFINDLNDAVMSTVKLNKEFLELALFGLNFTPYILEIQ